MELGAGRGPGDISVFDHAGLARNVPSYGHGVAGMCAQRRGATRALRAEPRSPGIVGTEEAGGIWP